MKMNTQNIFLTVCFCPENHCTSICVSTCEYDCECVLKILLDNI